MEFKNKNFFSFFDFYFVVEFVPVFNVFNFFNLLNLIESGDTYPLSLFTKSYITDPPYCPCTQYGMDIQNNC